AWHASRVTSTRASSFSPARAVSLSFLSSFYSTAPTHHTPLSLHAALPISGEQVHAGRHPRPVEGVPVGQAQHADPALPAPPLLGDRKSTRLNSSHGSISYAVFCLKNKTWIVAHVGGTVGDEETAI